MRLCPQGQLGGRAGETPGRCCVCRLALVWGSSGGVPSHSPSSQAPLSHLPRAFLRVSELWAVVWRHLLGWDSAASQPPGYCVSPHNRHVVCAVGAGSLRQQGF